MKILDCDAAYGRGTHTLPREIETVDALTAELDHCGIDAAWVWHRDAYERGFEAGNRRVAELDGHDRLQPVPTIIPTCCGEMPSAEGLVAWLRGHGAQMVRAFPTRHYYLLDPVSCGDLLGALSTHRTPLLVPLAEFPGQWQGVYALMRDFPDLTLVVTQSGCWGQDRYFRPLLEQYPRFHLTTNRLETSGQLASLVNALGSGQILFGSGLPFNYPGGYINMIHRADISDDAKAAVFHSNLERLLGEVDV
ncbi:MAG: amidohydrolase family protein [bacterium]|nr:amidohydrolase family protein [bacterium]